MARFLKHEACPNCGSRDNLGRWDDGSAFCFGCHYKEGRSGNPRDWMPKKEADDLEDERSYPKMPDDTGHSFSPEAVAWLQQYDVSVVEAIQRGFKWSESRQQLIFDMDQVWQARNFRSTYLSSDGSMKKASKYFTSGPVQDVLPLYKSQRQEVEETLLVIVEDCVSAIRIARQFDSMPVLGSHVANIKLNRLARLYSSFIVWLDGDKFKEAQATARSLTMLGRSARAIYTELDPKEYSDSEIMEILK